MSATKLLRRVQSGFRARIGALKKVSPQDKEHYGALLEQAGLLAQVGGWELDVETQQLFWTSQTYRIHELDEGTPVTLAQAIRFYTPQGRPVVAAAVKAALERDTPMNLELEIVTAKGKAAWIRAQGQTVKADGKVVKLSGAIQDITQSKRDALLITELAFSDTLTALPNRRLLIDRLEMSIASCQRQGHFSALVTIDLDNFKALNDSYGHFKGDMLLQAVAQELSESVSERGTVARVGADEFMVILTNLGSDRHEASLRAHTFTDELCARLRRSYRLGRLHHYSTASMGVALFGWAPESAEEPMKRADLALSKARARGGDTACLFEQAMQSALERHVELQAAIRHGLAHNEFMLYYQPQVVERDEGHRPIVGAETLIRWKHSTQGMISPSEFIPVAEDSGLILDLGKLVLTAACRQLAQWESHAHLAHLTLAVNVSARQFQQQDFVATVLQVLATTGAPAKRLKLELTEGMLVTNIDDVVMKMKSLKAVGVSFALDDFGTGYSSLSYLKRLPLDQLKIDQSFVHEILHDTNDAAIARTVIGLAHSLGLSIIAEGVETQEQRKFLASEGCIAYQGYLFSRPVPIQDFEALALRAPRANDHHTVAT